MTTRTPSHLQLVASNGQEIPEACHHVNRRCLHLADFALAPIEHTALAILRFLCSALASGSIAGVETAHDIAETRLGFADGAALVAHLTALLRAIRGERRHRFSYMAADCPTCSSRITREELLVIRLLRAARTDSQERLAQYATALAQKPEAPRIASAARSLGDRLAVYAVHTEILAPPAID